MLNFTCFLYNYMLDAKKVEKFYFILRMQQAIIVSLLKNCHIVILMA